MSALNEFSKAVRNLLEFYEQIGLLERCGGGSRCDPARNMMCSFSYMFITTHYSTYQEVLLPALNELCETHRHPLDMKEEVSPDGDYLYQIFGREPWV